jgi:hypothetical protein
MKVKRAAICGALARDGIVRAELSLSIAAQLGAGSVQELATC